MTIFLLLIFFFSSPIVIQSAQPSIDSVSYSDYNTPSSLINYLSNNKDFSSYNSIFFQFAPYIPTEQSKKILGSMTSLYEMSDLYGIILVLDKNSNIGNVDTYSNELLDLSEKKLSYKKSNTYIIILQYVPGESGEEWENSLYINVGGENAEKYLNQTQRNELINKWEKTLKKYDYTNFSRFYGEVVLKVFLNRDNIENTKKDDETSSSHTKGTITSVSSVYIIIPILLLLF